MKKILIGLVSVVGAVLLFAGGAFAANKGWLEFDGDEMVEDSTANVNEIMDILEEVNDGKITAEQAEERLNGEVAKLTEDKENLNGQLINAQDDIAYLEGLLEGLAGDTPGQKIKKLKEANDELRGENAQLVTDNSALNKTIDEQSTAIEELESNVATLTQERDDAVTEQERLQGELNQVNSDLEAANGKNAELQESIDELNKQISNNNDYIIHLEAELTEANEAVESHNNVTEEALQKAQTYQDGE